MICCLIDEKIRIFHEKWKVVDRYSRRYLKSNPTETISLFEVDESEVTEWELEEFYLVPCYKTYVPAKYYSIMLMDSDYEHKKFAEQELEKALLQVALTSDERRMMIRVLKAIRKRRRSCGKYTPSISQLEERWCMVNEYYTHMEY